MKRQLNDGINHHSNRTKLQLRLENIRELSSQQLTLVAAAGSAGGNSAENTGNNGSH